MKIKISKFEFKKLSRMDSLYYFLSIFALIFIVNYIYICSIANNLMITLNVVALIFLVSGTFMYYPHRKNYYVTATKVNKK